VGVIRYTAQRFFDLANGVGIFANRRTLNPGEDNRASTIFRAVSVLLLPCSCRVKLAQKKPLSSSMSSVENRSFPLKLSKHALFARKAIAFRHIRAMIKPSPLTERMTYQCVSL